MVAVYVTKAGASGDNVVFHNGVDASATVEFTVYGEGDRTGSRVDKIGVIKLVQYQSTVSEDGF